MTSRNTANDAPARRPHADLALDEPARLGAAATAVVRDPSHRLMVSAGTIWEVSIKVGIGRLSLSLPFREWMNRGMTDLGLSVVPITVEHADHQAALPLHHRDPFDRLLAAQALTERIPLVSADAVFDRYGGVRVWD